MITYTTIGADSFMYPIPIEKMMVTVERFVLYKKGESIKVKFPDSNHNHYLLRKAYEVAVHDEGFLHHERYFA